MKQSKGIDVDMREYRVETLEYELDVAAMIKRRLKGAEGVGVSVEAPGCALVRLRDEEAREALCTALCDVLLRDAAHFELAGAVDALPFSLEEKRAILPEAVRYACRLTAESKLVRGRAISALNEYTRKSERLNIEGFLRFRLREAGRAYAIAAARAADALLLRGEYMELMAVLSRFARMQPPRTKEVCLILHPDGSCTLSGAGGARIDCQSEGKEGVVSILLGLAPESILIYDLSCGRGGLLLEVVARVFRERVRLFR